MTLFLSVSWVISVKGAPVQFKVNIKKNSRVCDFTNCTGKHNIIKYTVHEEFACFNDSCVLDYCFPFLFPFVGLVHELCFENFPKFDEPPSKTSAVSSFSYNFPKFDEPPSKTSAVSSFPYFYFCRSSSVGIKILHPKSRFGRCVGP